MLVVPVASGTPRSKDNAIQEINPDFLPKCSPGSLAGTDLVAGKMVSGGDAGGGLLDRQSCSTHTWWCWEPHSAELTVSPGQGRNLDLLLAIGGAEFSEVSRAYPKLRLRQETTHPGSCSMLMLGP